jgi:hypothetical protein
LFEDSNLAASVKASIRDDIQLVYSHNPSSNAEYRVYQSGDAQFGHYLGNMHLDGNWICPAGLNSWNYVSLGGINYFCVTKEISDRYIQSIALTNQFHNQVASLSNFLHAAKTMTTNSITPAGFARLFWIHEAERAAQAADMGTPENINTNIHLWSSGTYYHPSILQFRDGADGDYAAFRCTVNISLQTTAWKNNRDPNPEELVYKNGRWRFVLRSVD